MRFGKEKGKRRKVILVSLQKLHVVQVQLDCWRIYFELGRGDR